MAGPLAGRSPPGILGRRNEGFGEARAREIDEIAALLPRDATFLGQLWIALEKIEHELSGGDASAGTGRRKAVVQDGGDLGGNQQEEEKREARCNNPAAERFRTARPLRVHLRENPGAARRGSLTAVEPVGVFLGGDVPHGRRDDKMQKHKKSE